MPGPYDSHGKNVNGVNRYDVFGSHSLSSIQQCGSRPIGLRDEIVIQDL